ncbi:MAG: FAD-dependent monooxygenase [Oscillospiraceae bacterium]|nr:FAD-dependent monooxygenase [Oscillospiraceae bacterium]
MKTEYDVLVLGSGPVGMMFAKMMAEKGFSVAAADAAKKEELGDTPKIFHADVDKFLRYGLPEPRPGDPDYADEFKEGLYRSPYDRHEKVSHCRNFLLRQPEFLARLRGIAEAAGAEFFYETAFVDFLLDENESIHGAKLRTTDGIRQVKARLTVDATGKAAAARRKVRKGTADDWELTNRDLFYIYLHYVKLKNPEKDKPAAPIHYAQYKTWIGQSGEDDGCLFGAAANLSFEYAEKCLNAFKKNVPLPEYTLVRTETGATPYRHPSYSMVADGFLAVGDSVCMTKPFSGEGITASWVGCEHAAAAAETAMANGAYPTEEALWNYNVTYARTQAADFAYINAVLANAADTDADENEYMFAHDIVFNDAALTQANVHYNYDVPFSEVIKLLGRLIVGVLTRHIAGKSLKLMLRGIIYATLARAHYRKFPKKVAGFAKWKAKAEKIWSKTGTLCDILERTQFDEARATKSSLAV